MQKGDTPWGELLYAKLPSWTEWMGNFAVYAVYLNDKDDSERTRANRGTRVKRLQALPSSTAHRFRRVWLAVDFAEPCSLSSGREGYQCDRGTLMGISQF